MKLKRYINENEEKQYPSLKLKSVFGEAIRNETIEILASGYAGSKRNSRDGVTFFGCRQKEVLDPMIDYELNITNSNLNQIYSSIIFMIYFKKDELKYYLRAVKQSNETGEGLPNIIIQISEPYVSNLLIV